MANLRKTKHRWLNSGLIATDDEILAIYYIREFSTHCEKCGKEFKSKNDRHMDHCHETGKFRNILCNSCNIKRCTIYKNNTSGYLNISKVKCNNCIQGFRWVFKVHLNGKYKSIKYSVDKEWLIEYAEQWKKENHYND